MVDFIDPFQEQQELDFVDPFDEEEETEKEQPTSGELDLDNLRQRRETNTQTDAEIIQSITSEVGPNLKIDGKPFSLDSLLEQNQSPSSILDFITSGNVVDTNIDSQGKAILAAAGKASTDANPVALAMDLGNAALQSAESLGRRGANKLASFNAP